MKSKATFEKQVDNTVKTLKFTGKIPVDEECVTAIGNDFHVYIEDDDTYDCMLNQVRYENFLNTDSEVFF